jgi:cytochrome P450
MKGRLMTIAVPSPGSPSIRRGCPFDPPEDYRELRDSGEHGTFPLPGGRVARLLTSYADITAMLSDPRFKSSANRAPAMTDKGTPGWFFGLDGAEHARYRRLLAGSFTLRAARRNTERIERIVTAQLDEMAGAGASADLLCAFAWPLPGLVMNELLGLSPDVCEEFEWHMAAMDNPEATSKEERAAFRGAWELLFAVCLDKQRDPGDDLISDLLREGPDGQAITAEEGASMALSLQLGGRAPVSHVLVMSVFALLSGYGDGLREAIEDPQRLDAAVEELLRYIPSNNLGVVRVAGENVSIGAHEVQAGEFVFVSLPVAGRDPERFGQPETLDVNRRPGAHVAFGHGAHHCLGQNLARLELRVALRELFRRFPALRLAVPHSAVKMQDTETTYSVVELPVAW